MTTGERLEKDRGHPTKWCFFKLGTGKVYRALASPLQNGNWNSDVFREREGINTVISACFLDPLICYPLDDLKIFTSFELTRSLKRVRGKAGLFRGSRCSPLPRFCVFEMKGWRKKWSTRKWEIKKYPVKMKPLTGYGTSDVLGAGRATCCGVRGAAWRLKSTVECGRHLGNSGRDCG